MKNLYQSVLDEVNEKRRALQAHGWQPSPKLLLKVGEYQREQEARRVDKLLDRGDAGHGNSNN